MTISAQTIPMTKPFQLKHSEFKLLQSLFFRLTGIALNESKKQLIISRLAKRLRNYNFESFYQYYCLLKNQSADHNEVRCFVDKLTTHETAFFREPKHFEFLADTIKQNYHLRPIRVWSAACSTGEEAYSIAMTINRYVQHNQWQIIASDVSTQVLQQARSRCYPRQSIDSIPTTYRLKHCLLGTGPKQHQMKLKKALATKIQFNTINLSTTLPPMPAFDFIFLRNVLIYFDQQAKREIISRLAQRLNPNGYLLLGHSESLLNHPKLKLVQPTVYQLRG